MNKKVFALTAAVSAAVSLATVCHAEYYESASPSEAVITVDGAKKDITAYNISGNNYCRLRDVAAALSGTDKRFNAEWDGGKVEITTGVGYEGSAEKPYAVPQTAALSMHRIEVDGVQSRITGYVIGGNNYFKLRDIGLILDFGVDYSTGTVMINTNGHYEPEAAAPTMVYESDLPLFIDELPVRSYYATATGAYDEILLERLRENPRLIGVFVDALELGSYGFDVQNTDNVYVTQAPYRDIKLVDTSLINSAPDYSEYMPLCENILLDGSEFPSVGDYAHRLIPAVKLLDYGKCEPVSAVGFYEIGKYENRLNIDIYKQRLENEYDSFDAEETEDSYSFPGLTGRAWNKSGLSVYKFRKNFNNYSYDYDCICYIGEGYDYRCDGYGIWLEEDTRSGGGGQTAVRHSSFKRGLFKNNELYSGIFYEQRNAYRMYFPRIEGDMSDGWQRRCETDRRTRFGYRVVDEGEVTDGDFSGSYKHYDESGALIFEGDHADYIKETN